MNEDFGLPLYPTPTAGDGRLTRTHLKSGAGQDRGSPKKIVSCRQCGFKVDRAKVDGTGGTYQGDGGLGGVTKTDNSATLKNGDTLSAKYGDRDVKKNAGCPHCGSKNF